MRIRKVKTQTQMDELIDEYITLGYNVRDRGEKTVTAKKRDYGSLASHIVVFILFGWWTFLIANLIWAVYKWTTADEVLIKIVGETET